MQKSLFKFFTAQSGQKHTYQNLVIVHQRENVLHEGSPPISILRFYHCSRPIKSQRQAIKVYQRIFKMIPNRVVFFPVVFALENYWNVRNRSKPEFETLSNIDKLFMIKFLFCKESKRWKLIIWFVYTLFYGWWLHIISELNFSDCWLFSSWIIRISLWCKKEPHQ